MHDVNTNIMMQRYSLRREDHIAEVGDTVTALRLGPGKVLSIRPSDRGSVYTIQFDSGVQELTNREFDVPLELTWDDIADRVGEAVGFTDKERYDFKNLIAQRKLIPGGRILAAAGNIKPLSYYNCYVIESPEDSRKGILSKVFDMADIMARGGGAGFNASTLRPQNAIVYGVNGSSSGSVSWASLFSYTTGLISQGGSRRGALMIELDVWHPDIETFITAKLDGSAMTNCNMSVAISDTFMAAVENDYEWDLLFPDTSDNHYDKEWDGDINKWRKNGYKVIIYKTLPARQLWDLICETAWKSGEPGLWFSERSNRNSNSFYYNRLQATNPCGEQPLPPWGVCNLASINLPEFIVDGQFRYDLLREAVSTSVRFLDNVVTLQEQTIIDEDWYRKVMSNQVDERRIGLCTMGLAEAMAVCGVAYGDNEDCKDFIDNIYMVITDEAYLTSMLLAEENAPFAKWDKRMADSGYIKRNPHLEKYVTRGTRNVTLTSIAPNGTIATMMNTSTGVEPFFAPSWNRASRVGDFTEESAITKGMKGQKLPGHYRFAMPLTKEQRKYFGNMTIAEAVNLEISPRDHVMVLAWVAKWIDSAVSKTVNLENSATIEDVKDTYWLMYTEGAPGGTIYRDGSRGTQVLTLDASSEDDPNGLTCPECHSANYIDEAGCKTCYDCGWGVCDSPTRK